MERADRTNCLYVLNQHVYPQKLLKTVLNCHFRHWFKIQHHTDWKPEFKMLQEEHKLWELSFCSVFSSYATFPSATWSINQTKFTPRLCWKSYVFLMKKPEIYAENLLKIMTKVLEVVYTRQLEENEWDSWVHPLPPFLCYAATSPWCCSRDQGVVQERKNFLTPTILHTDILPSQEHDLQV